MVLPFLKVRHTAQGIASDLPALKQSAHDIASQILHGSHGQRKQGGYENFWQFREYNEIDRPQDIDWRQSAKNEHVFIREKELQTPQSVYFWTKCSAGMRFQSAQALHSKAEAAAILNVALAILFQAGDERVGALDAKGGKANAGRSDSYIDAIARVATQKEAAGLPQFSLPSKSAAVLSGDFLEDIDAIETCFHALSSQRSRGLVIQTLDPAELTLPYNGRTIFEGSDKADYRIDNVSSIRGEYQKRIKDHTQQIEHICQQQEWNYYLHVTDTPMNQTLHHIWLGEQKDGRR